MASRFYFPESTAAAVSPSFRGTWSTTTGAVRREMVTSKGASAITASNVAISGSPVSGLLRQYVSQPLAAQTILGTATMAGSLLVAEGSAADNVNTTLVTCFLVSNDGTAVIADLFGWNAYGTFGSEFDVQPGYRNSILAVSGTFDIATYGSTGGNVTVSDGDRLVLEIGASSPTAPGGSNIYAKFGENASDLPPDDETQTTDGAGWFELSQTLVFQTAGGDVLDPMGAAGFFGA